MKAPDSGTYQLVIFWKLLMTAEAQILHLLEGQAFMHSFLKTLWNVL